MELYYVSDIVKYRRSNVCIYIDFIRNDVLDKHVTGGKGKSKESVRRSLQLQFSFIRYVF